MLRFVLLALAATALVVAESDVVELTASDFSEKTQDGFWFIEFFAPWCGHCKKLAPTWEHLATGLKGKFNIAKVDCTAHKSVCSDNGVRGFPTLKLFENGEDKEKYAGARDAVGFVKFLQEKANLPADVKIANLPADKPAPAKAAPPAADEGPSDVISLKADDFADKTKEGFWLIKFYAPWCGHCKRLAPTWNHLATELKGKANIAKVDCTQTGSLCSTSGVKGYPTIKLFKDGEEVEKYAGGRDTDSLVKYMKDKKMIADDVTVKPAAGDKPAKKKPEPKEKDDGPTNVVKLTNDDFDQKTKDGAWLIKFYAPWCGHCKKLAPTWEELATKVNLIDSAAKIAKVDCTIHKEVCQNQGVKGYPTLKLFKDGKEDTPYRGKRTLDAFEEFLKKNVDENVFDGKKHDEL